ncbi:glycosyltransferase [Pediococcus cellicola]|uniref:Cps1G protein n=1 Tax=Pediococcus cellicola TaxID=319652 RepID=A0A0R2IWL6_9LACO|nr:glycosyltransferase [Pediococcus cellicola]KRN66077.1 cps1G protein [Pediococcus cellicola]GEL15451.1 glycosyltransferase family 1 (GT1) [Pediococcus cellicola]
MKKILVVGDFMVRSGVTHFIFNSFGNLDPHKYKIDVVNVSGKNECQQKLDDLGWHQYMIRPANQKLLMHLKDWFLFLKANASNYDAIHFNYSAMWNFLPILFAKLFGIKQIVIHSHNTYFGTDGSATKLKILTRLHNLGKAIICNWVATDFLAVSEQAAKWLFTAKIINKNAYRIVNNGIDLDKYKFDVHARQRVRTQLNLNSKKVYGHVGVFEKRKNHRFLIETFNHIQIQEPNAVLMLIGEGVLQDKIKAQVHNLGLDEKVLFMGRRNDLNRLYSAMDALIFPSLHEGLSTVFVEAQDSGLPIFISAEIPLGNYLKDLVVPISLTKNASQWAACILKHPGNPNRLEQTKQLKKNGYGFGAAIRVLEKVYQD